MWTMLIVLLSLMLVGSIVVLAACKAASRPRPLPPRRQA
jgi:hypothetical protein